ILAPHQPSIRPSKTGHDASMRTSSLLLDARAPNQSFGMVFTCQGHPRAALDKGDLWISNVLPQHPVESHGQLPGRRHLGHAFRLMVAASRILLAKSFIQPGYTLRPFHQQLAQKPVALLADRAQPLPAARAVLSRNQSDITGHLVAVPEPAH